METSTTANSKPRSLADIPTEDLLKSLKLRRKANPHKYYVPNGRVEEFIRLVGANDTFISLFSAANGVGKTACGANIVAHILYGQSGNPYFDGLPLFDKFPFPKAGRIISDPTTIQGTIIPELKKWLPPGRYTTSKHGKNYEYEWKTDTGFQFELMSYEQDVKEFESSTLGWAWFDEPPPLPIFKATVARMRRGGIIFITATPLTGSAWMYDHIIAHRGDEQGQRAYIHASIEANCITHGVRGILKHSDILKMVNEYDEEDKQARIYGKFQHLVGLVFKKFERRVHVIKPFHITRKDYVVWEALDPHPRNPDAVVWIATDAKGRKFVCDELYTADYFNGTWTPYRLTNAALVQRINAKSAGFRLEERIADPSAFVEDKHQDDPEQMTLAARLAALGLDYAPATKDRTTADRLIAEALDFQKVGDELLKAPELYIFDTCIRTIWELEHLQWEDWRGKAAERKSPRERPMDKDDHCIECVGRILVQQPEWHPMPVERTVHSEDVDTGKTSKDFDVYS